jgi:hypothetical protein
VSAPTFGPLHRLLYGRGERRLGLPFVEVGKQPLAEAQSFENLKTPRLMGLLRRAGRRFTISHMKIAWITPVSFAVLFVGVLAFPTKANALGPVDIEIGARAGVTTSPLGPLGFGIGGRGGVSIMNIYAGIDVIDYLGAHAPCGGCSLPPPPAGQMQVQAQQWRSALLYGFEAGYNFKFSLVTIRPQLGLGNFHLSAWYGAPGGGVISNYFYAEPGVVGLVSLGMFFVGADVGVLLLSGPDSPETGLTVHGQVGVTF